MPKDQKPIHPVEGGRSRCDSCDNFATEGESHRCPNGNSKDEWTNPAEPKRRS